METTLDRMKSKINNGITTVSLKTNSSLEKNKINMKIKSLSNEINTLEQEMGHCTYNYWKDGVFDVSQIEELLLTIDKKLDEITELKNKSLEIEKHENEILEAMKNANIAETYICASCRTVYSEKSNFCVKCGSKMI